MEKMVKTEDPVWFHFTPIRKRSSLEKWAKCKYCAAQIVGDLEHLKFHQERCEGKADTKSVSDESSCHTWISSIYDDVDAEGEADEAVGEVEDEDDQVDEDGIEVENAIDDEFLKCVLCGDSAAPQIKNQNDHLFALWDENCSKSFCKLFSLQRSFRGMILKADYCPRCHNILRDIDFSFRTLQLLEDKLQQSRTTVESLLKENYDSVTTCETEPEYKQLVKSFYRTVLPGNQEDEDAEEEADLEKPAAPVEAHYEEDTTTAVGVSTRRGSKTKSRSAAPAVVEYSLADESRNQEESDGFVDDGDDGLEFEAPPQVEVILKSGFDAEVPSDEPSDDPDVHTDDFSTPDNSSDEDWQMEPPSSAKKKAKVKKTSTPRISMAPRVAFKSETKTVLIVKKDEFVKKKVPPKPKPKPKIIRKGMSFRPPVTIGTGDGDRRVIWVNPEKTRPGQPKGPGPAPKANQNAVGRLKCEEENCTFTCAVKYKLDAHVNKVHREDPTPFHCKKCGEKFGSNTRYYLHQKKHRDEGQGVESGAEEAGKEAGWVKDTTPLGPCKFCQKQCSTRRELRKHIALRHPFGEMLTCSYCGKMYENEKQAEMDEHENIHRARISMDPFSCIICNSGFTNRQDLKTHVRQDHEPLLAPNKCGECNKVFDVPMQLKRHILTVHTQRSTDFQCPQCPYVALDSKGLSRHSSCHDTTRNYVCEICGVGYKAKSGLNYHIRASHSDTRNYACQICDKKFVSGCLLKAHEESHNSIKSYVCESCGKAFMTQKSLYQHSKIHLGIKTRYGKRFKNRTSEPTPRRRQPQKVRTPSSSSAESSKSREERMETLSSEPSASPVYERQEPLPAHFGDRPQQSTFQQPLVPAPHFLMGSGEGWDRPQPHSSSTHQFQSPTVGVDGYPFTTIDLSHTSQLLSVLHQQQQQRRASAQFPNNNYFRNQH